MAQKQAKAPSAGETSSPAEQLQVIHPSTEITIAGRDLVIREYSFFEGLEVAHRAEGFIAGMHDMCRDGDLRYDRIRRLFGVHQDTVIPIAAQSAGVEVEWVRGLSRDDSDAFMSIWFGVNVGFFVREVAVEMREERQRAALSLIGSSSLSGLPDPGSATSGSLDAAQNGS